jgi:ferredoxin-thioredoxin reductase catalytic chain
LSPAPDPGKLLEKLKSDAEDGGYNINPDPAFALELAEGISTNVERFGYQLCPCRLGTGNRAEDLDIICPCDYRDADVVEYDTCY